MACAPHGGRAFVCPTEDQLAQQALTLLPRGDAWATSDGAILESSVLVRYWRAVSDVFAFVYRRLCALREEFWCATQSETRAEWMREYGLPDACDPYPDLCAKVAAIGGARCEDLIAIAARAGWTIACAEGCGGEAGCMEAGLDPAGSGSSGGILYILVLADESPAYVPLDSMAEAGCMEAGQALRCDPLEALRCLMDRVVQAHLFVVFTILSDFDFRLLDENGWPILDQNDQYITTAE